MIHVCLGTKAQYIKTAPLLRRMDSEGVQYRLVDFGQHGAFATGLREQLELREPDISIGGTKDVNTIRGVLVWALRICRLWFRSGYLRSTVFAGEDGYLVVHGDTPSTFLSTLLGRRAGLRVAHLEAGLRSWRLLHPFPEEMIRVLVMRQADLLFAPGEEYVSNLEQMKVRGRVINTRTNTGAEMMTISGAGDRERSLAVVTCHRVENLRRPKRLRQLVELVRRLSSKLEVVFILHPPTAETLEQSGLLDDLKEAAEVQPLMPHAEFLALLGQASLVVTDGGSIQEECALTGVPTLLWRARTERVDGLGANIVLSEYDARTIDRFLANYAGLRRDPVRSGTSASAVILDELRSEIQKVGAS